MTPQEKADELIDKFYRNIRGEFAYKDFESARKCAIICCKEAKLAASTALTIVDKRKENQGLDDIIDTDDILFDSCVPYWDAVIEQIQSIGYPVEIKQSETK